jgi:hypothetical protein
MRCPFLKHKLRECEVTYVELAKRLRRHGFKDEAEASLTNKLARGDISGHFLFGLPSSFRTGWRGRGNLDQVTRIFLHTKELRDLFFRCFDLR